MNLKKQMIDLKRRMEQKEAQAAQSSGNPDAAELAEREAAAQAYAGENEKHFASYLQDCVNQSVRANTEIRKTQAHCYRVYLENEPVNYARKDYWQSRIVVPKPFGTVQYGASALKRAFSPNFLTIHDAKNKTAETFWQKILDTQLNHKHAKFIQRFIDATTMALAVGISQEVIPRWIPGAGLQFSLVEPWKIHRDPDAATRDPQSGLYWIHQEWLDWHVLLAGEKSGKYQNVRRLHAQETEDNNNPWMTQEAIAARKGMIWERSTYRPMILTSEFWGTVLSPKGEVLLQNARFTTAAGRVIEKPTAAPYKGLRWPGMAYSPLPDLLKFNGRGLLEGILTLWEAMCNLMCLHQDALQWQVNPMTEINVDALVDAADTETWPGKEYLVKDTQSGQQAVREVRRYSKTNEILANMQYHDQNYQRGSFVNDAVQGLPGYRKDMTYREAAMNLDQALGVYSLMGENIEAGAIDIVTAGCEFIRLYATWQDLVDIFTPEELEGFGIHQVRTGETASPGGLAGIPEISGTFHISGIQALMKENEALANLKEVVLPLSQTPRFAPFIRPYNVLKSIEIRTNLTDEKLFVSEDEAKLIEAGEFEQMAAMKKAEAIAAAQAQAQGSQAPQPNQPAPGAPQTPAQEVPQ